MGSDIVTLVVGPEKYVFNVHRKFLCDKIKYFERMFMGSFKEATTNTATFPEDDRKSFGLLLKWVYDGTIPPVLYHKDNNQWKENWFPIKLYQLGDKFNIPEVMDRTLDAFIISMKKYNLIPAADEIDEGYTRTPPGSQLRAFLCDVFVYRLINAPDAPGCLRNEQAQKLIADQPDLAQDMIPLLRMVPEQTFKSLLEGLPSCKYHTHPVNRFHSPNSNRVAICPWKAKKSKEEQAEV